MQLTEPNISSIYFLHTSGNEAAQAAGQRYLGLIVVVKAKAAFLD